MKIYRTFPLQDFVEVPIEGIGILKVKFKYPTIAQTVVMGRSQSVAERAMLICKFCVEDILELEDQDGKPIRIVLENKPDMGKELPEHIVLALMNNGFAYNIAVFYNDHLYIGETDKKKSPSSPDASEQANPLPT
jgi:hypothetical protein